MDAQAKQQLVERVKQVSNILVTVSRDPSVDQLAACIGLTLLLNRVGKHTTAVFSGKVPSTIEFLQPEKTIQTSTDSLRDFIISLDKEKADKLRYKIEDQFVRIYITPYKTSLSEKDLLFTQGEYNVELVIALGVKNQTQLDAAITAHGKILHDAVVVSVNAGNGQAPKLGQINWQEATASSLSEMIVSVSESFGSNLIDAQMATAFLTGIVAETERFSNAKTSPKVMTMSAQLMAAGANQQLIASKLAPPQTIVNIQSQAAKPADQQPQATADGTLKVEHATPPPMETPIDTSEIKIDQEGNLKSAGQKEPPPQPNQPIVPPPVAVPETSAPQPIEAPGEVIAPTAVNQASMPGTHNLLNNAPSFEPAFSASGQDDEDVATDPLISDNGAPSNAGFLSHARDIQPPTGNTTLPAPSADAARNAVESAYAATTDNPAAEALANIPDIPATPPPQTPPPPQSQPETQPPVPAQTPPEQESKNPPPPPFPPPLTTSKGVVIPPPFNGQNNNQV